MALLDLSSDPSPQQPPLSGEGSKGAVPRKFVGVKFNCCNVYVRIYVNKEGTAYEGRCPKCYRNVKFQIGSGGTDHRFFEAY